MGVAMKFRAAIPDDLDLLRYWDGKAHVIAAGGGNDVFDWETELPRSPSWRELLIAEQDGRPIGSFQIIDPAQEETHYWGDVAPNLRAIDIWIGEESDLGCGYGTEIMQLWLSRYFAKSEVTAVLIDPLISNTAAHRFYERLGFRRQQQRRFGPDDCYVYCLTRQDCTRR